MHEIPKYVDRNACIPIEGDHWLQGRWERLNNDNGWDVRYASRNPTVKEPDVFWRGCSGDCCSGNKARHLSMPCITRLRTAVARSATVVSTLISIRTVRKKDCDPTAGNYRLLFSLFHTYCDSNRGGDHVRELPFFYPAANRIIHVWWGRENPCPVILPILANLEREEGKYTAGVWPCLHQQPPWSDNNRCQAVCLLAAFMFIICCRRSFDVSPQILPRVLVPGIPCHEWLGTWVLFSQPRHLRLHRR